MLRPEQTTLQVEVEECTVVSRGLNTGNSVSSGYSEIRCAAEDFVGNRVIPHCVSPIIEHHHLTTLVQVVRKGYVREAGHNTSSIVHDRIVKSVVSRVVLKDASWVIDVWQLWHVCYNHLAVAVDVDG